MTAFKSRQELDGALAATPGTLVQQLYRDIGRAFVDTLRTFAGLGGMPP